VSVDRAIPILCLLLVGGANFAAFSAASAARPAVLYWLLGAYVPLGILAFWRMDRDGTMLDLFRWRSGDIALGGAVAIGLAASMYFGRQMVAPRGSVNEAWLMRLYLHLGEMPAERTKLVLLSLGIIAVAALEEIVWRGLVQQVLEEWLGARGGWLSATALYALAHVPTIWLLAMPSAGENPLLPLAAAYCGIVWGFLTARLQRLPPALVSHVLFTWGLAAQFPLWTP
jgi:uncharacterized protein